MKPLVSVIMPAYNAERYIAQSIDSILNQTYDNIELLIYDDGSTDGTRQLLYDKYIIDSVGNVVLFAENENKGITYGLNKLIQKAEGKYIARMDADDIAMPDRIEKQVQLIGEQSWAVAIGCSVEMFGDKNYNNERNKWWGNEYIFHEQITKILPYRNCLCHPSVLFYAFVLKEYMYQDGVFQDYDLFLRMGSGGLTIIKNPEMLLKYRVRSDSEAAKNESDWAEIKLKLRFLIKKFPHWNKFDTHVMRSIWQIIRR